jgi:hypothetical protein
MASAEETHHHRVPSCLRRLNNLLRVDFAKGLGVTDGKRKREPTRSIYEEAEHDMKKDMAGKARKRLIKKVNSIEKRKYTTKHRKQDAAASTSDSAGEEEEDPCNMATMMNAATALAKLRDGTRQSPAEHSSSAETFNHQLSFAEKTIELLTKAHENTLEAKDYIIKSVTAALIAKEELILEQAKLIASMRQSAADA